MSKNNVWQLAGMGHLSLLLRRINSAYSESLDIVYVN